MTDVKKNVKKIDIKLTKDQPKSKVKEPVRVQPVRTSKEEAKKRTSKSPRECKSPREPVKKKRKPLKITDVYKEKERRADEEKSST